MAERITFETSKEQLARIEEWRAQRRPIPPRNEALRALLDYALASEAAHAKDDDKERQQP